MKNTSTLVVRRSRSMFASWWSIHIRVNPAALGQTNLYSIVNRCHFFFRVLTPPKRMYEKHSEMTCLMRLPWAAFVWIKLAVEFQVVSSNVFVTMIRSGHTEESLNTSVDSAPFLDSSSPGESVNEEASVLVSTFLVIHLGTGSISAFSVFKDSIALNMYICTIDLELRLCALDVFRNDSTIEDRGISSRWLIEMCITRGAHTEVHTSIYQLTHPIASTMAVWAKRSAANAIVIAPWIIAPKAVRFTTALMFSVVWLRVPDA